MTDPSGALSSPAWTDDRHPCESDREAPVLE